MNLVNTQTNAALPLKQYPRPKRVVRTFNIYLSGKKMDVVTTRGEKYTYMTLDGVDYYVDACLDTDGRYKVVEVKEEAKQ